MKLCAEEIDHKCPEGWRLFLTLEFREIALIGSNAIIKMLRKNDVEFIKWLLYADDLVLFCPKGAPEIFGPPCLRFSPKNIWTHPLYQWKIPNFQRLRRKFYTPLLSLTGPQNFRTLPQRSSAAKNFDTPSPKQNTPPSYESFLTSPKLKK